MKKRIILLGIMVCLMAAGAFFSADTFAAGLSRPELVSLTSGGSGQMTIRWKPVSGAEGYNIYRASGSDVFYRTTYDKSGGAYISGDVGFVRIGTVKGGGTDSFTDTTAVDGRTYEYTVEAYRGNEKSGYNVGLFGHTAFEVLFCWEMRIENLTSQGFDLVAKVVSDTGISRVDAAVWTQANGQDDIVWTQMQGSGGVYRCRVNTSDHGNRDGRYIIHVIPKDNYGKVSEDYGDATRNFAYVYVPKGTTLTNPVINGVTSDGYQVALTYYADGNVTRAEAVTWTSANGQDDLRTTEAYIDRENHIIRADIRTADHNYEQGEFCTTVRLFNADGTCAEYDFRLQVGNFQNDLSVTHIDVGFGEATLIESRGQYLLLDCAESDSIYNVIQVLKEKKASKIPVMISHRHSDHGGGLISLIDAGFVSEIYIDTKSISDVYLDERKIEENLRYAQSRGIPVIDINSKKTYWVGGAKLEIIGPVAEYDYRNSGMANNRSVWIKLTGAKSVTYLFAGDTQRLAELAMARAGAVPDVDYLKVSHHGLQTSNSYQVLEAATPQMAFVSDNAFNVAIDSPGVLRLEKSGIPYYRTRESGTILNRITGKISTVVAMKSRITNGSPIVNGGGNGGSGRKYVYNGVSYDNEFDPAFYANAYADLRAAFGNNENLLLKHYAECGKREGRIAKDPNSSNRNQGTAGNYVYNGVSYDSEFNPQVYADRYPDLRAAFGYDANLLLQHWVECGKREGRRAN